MQIGLPLNGSTLLWRSNPLFFTTKRREEEKIKEKQNNPQKLYIMVSETSASSFPWKVVVGSAVAVGGAYVLYKTFGADETAANPRTPAAAAAAPPPLSSKSSSQPHSAGVTAAVPPPPVEKEERHAPPSAPAVPAEQSHGRSRSHTRTYTRYLSLSNAPNPPPTRRKV